MTIAERYSRAIQSSHLELSTLKVGDIDFAIAAGMVKGLGTGVLRLRAEFDAISSKPGAWQMRSMLTSAVEVRRRLIAMALDQGAPDDAAIDIAAKLMDFWLSPWCEPCTGLGVIGEYGGPRPVCPTCDGGKRRRLWWPDTVRQVADRMAAEVERKVETAERRIRGLLRQG